MLNLVEPQKIVERLNKILYKNINIMDRKGIIIASNDITRIGDLHEASLESAKEDKIITISSDNISEYGGSKEGINLPIKYKDEVIGVVGISGIPKEVTSFGLILKELVEHIFSENVVKTSDEYHQESLKLFFLELFKLKQKQDYSSFYQKANDLQINYKDKHIVIGMLKYFKDSNDDSGHIYEYSIKDIKTYLRDNLGYCFLIYDNQLLMISRKTYMLEKKLNEIAKEVKQLFGAKIKFVYGDICTSLEDYPIQYKLLNRMSRFRKVTESENIVHSTKENEELFLIENLSDEYINEYLLFYRDVFINKDTKISDVIIKTIKTFFEHDMSITDTSYELYVHRNTVSYRLRKFRDDYDIDIFKPKVCMKLYLAILCLEKKDN